MAIAAAAARAMSSEEDEDFSMISNWRSTASTRVVAFERSIRLSELREGRGGFDSIFHYDGSEALLIHRSLGPHCSLRHGVSSIETAAYISKLRRSIPTMEYRTRPKQQNSSVGEARRRGLGGRSSRLRRSKEGSKDCSSQLTVCSAVARALYLQDFSR